MACNVIFAVRLGLFLIPTIICGQLAGTVDGELKSPDLGEVTRLILEGTNQFRKQEGREELKSQPQARGNGSRLCRGPGADGQVEPRGRW